MVNLTTWTSPANIGFWGDEEKAEEFKNKQKRLQILQEIIVMKIQMTLLASVPPPPATRWNNTGSRV